MKVAATLEYVKCQQIGVGEGMNSEVYLAHDPQLGGEVVVKEIPLASFGNTVNGYFAEAQAMFASTHDNVVPVHYAGTAGTNICITMPYFPAGSWAKQLAVSPAPISSVVRIGQDVLAGLAHIHIAGYVHFDVKPSNVLLSKTGRGLVSDFGQSRAIGPKGTIALPSLYWACVPPEAYASAVTLLADVYQTGLLLYRAVNGEAEWSRQLKAVASRVDDAIKRGRFPDRKYFLPHVPDRLRRAIRKALSIDPKDRHQSAVEFADDLGHVAPVLDWSCQTNPTGATVWSADRGPRPRLVVELQPASAGKWDVQVFTDGKGKRRGREKTSAWKAGLALEDARRHLRKVFKSLT